jgi:hypothetical protein
LEGSLDYIHVQALERVFERRLEVVEKFVILLGVLESTR